MTMWKLCVPTLGRKNPLILKMLDKDPSLEIDFFVRGEDYESGFYDELKQKDRVHVHSLGYGLHELGTTRKRILNWCEANEVDFCCMFDDGIYNVEDTIWHTSISRTLTLACTKMINDQKWNKVIGFSFVKRYALQTSGEEKFVNVHSKNDWYFVNFPCQACIIDVQMAKRNKVSYKSLDDVGFEDAAFFIDSIKKGLIWIGRKNICIDGVVPNASKSGGSHSSSESIEQKYDLQTSKCMNYIGDFPGVRIEKRWHNYMNANVAFIIYDLEYFASKV